MRKGYKGFYYEEHWDGKKEGDCSYEVNGAYTYPKIYGEGHGSCFSSTKCNFRPKFSPARDYIYGGDYSQRNLGGGEYRRGGVGHADSGTSSKF